MQEEVDSDRLTIGLAPSSLFTCNPEIFRKVAQLASKENLPVALRLAGDREECDFVRYGSSPFSVHSMDTTRCYVEVPPWLPTGTTPVNYVLNWGAFESDNVMMVHGVYVDDHDVAKLKEYDVSVASCPRINAQLGMGVAPLAEFLNNGLRVGLGTDSPAATDSTDMISEMHTGMLIQRAVNPRSFMKSSTMLEMATIGGAARCAWTTRWAAWRWASWPTSSPSTCPARIKRRPPTRFRPWSTPATAPTCS